MSETAGGPDEVVAERYAIERELGSGGSAVVYLARDLQDDSRVALKLLHQEFAGSKAAERFALETRLLREFEHGAILPVRDAGEWKGRPFYVMPFVDGESLQARIKRERRLPFDEVVRIGKRLCDALAYAHERKVVHRDVKPANVMLAGDAVYLTDFGIAKALEPVEGAPHSTTGVARGTRAYMSPEQVTADRDLDHRSDIFSLGCVLYEMIAGVRPFYSADEARELMRRLMEAPDPLKRHRDGVPVALERVVMKALAREPADRWQGVGEMGEGLGTSVSVRAPARSRRWWRIAAAAAAVVTATVATPIALRDDDRTSSFRRDSDARVHLADFAIVALLPPRPAAVADSVPTIVNRLAASIELRLSRWRDLSLHVVSARDIAEVSRVVNIESSSVERPAIRARRVAAIQEVWRDGKWTITMRWFDQEDGITHAGISASIDRADSTSIEQAADRLVAELLASPGAPFIRTGTSGTASYRALRAFQEGSHELSQGRLAEATKSFQGAIGLDRDYGDAHLWFAQSVAWASGRTGEAAASAERAAILLQGDSGRSPEHAAALRDLLLSKYEPACRRFSALSARYPDWAPAHIGLGDCLLRDPTVEADETSPSRWRFRTDWGLAARAYEAALRASGGGRIAEMVYRRVLDALVTEGARIRLGANGLVPTDSFAALPSLRAGEVLFTPYRLSEFRAGAPGTVPVTMSRALVHQRERALTIASSWARLDSTNTEARLALAIALEAVGEIGDGTSAFESALAELRWVRRRRQARSDQIGLANAEVRLMLKVGMMAAAGELADSILRDVKGVTPAEARLLAPIAALRADVAKAVTLLEVAWRSPSSYTANDLQQVPPSLRNALARVVVHTSLGLCGGTLDSLTSVSERLAAATVEPARLEQWRQATLSRWWSAQAPCTKGRSVLQVADSSQGIVRLERALVAGDLREVRNVWSQIVATRQGADASSVAVDIVLTEAWVLMQAGMANEAMRHVENALEALPRAPATVSEELEQFAAVVGLMALRERSRNSATSSRGTVAQGESWDKLVGAAGAALIRRGSWWIRPTGT